MPVSADGLGIVFGCLTIKLRTASEPNNNGLSSLQIKLLTCKTQNVVAISTAITIFMVNVSG